MADPHYGKARPRIVEREPVDGGLQPVRRAREDEGKERRKLETHAGER